jgi:hypothetical protein
MPASSPPRPTPEPASATVSPPADSQALKSSATGLRSSTSNGHDTSLLSDTETLGNSSPELPALSAPPRFGLTPRTPQVDRTSSTRSEAGFYTASWGSPYDLPAVSAGNPPASAPDRRHRESTASLEDIEEDSPNLRFGLSHLIPSRLPASYDVTPTRPSTPNQLSPEEDTPRSSKIAKSGLDNGDNLPRNLAATFAKSRGTRGTSISGAADYQPKHRSRLSNRTLRQEDILADFPRRVDSLKMQSSKFASPARVAPKPELQEPEREAPQSTSPALTDGMTPPPLGERTSSTVSVPSSRNKKRVLYKGKTCWICLPNDPPRGVEGYAPMPLSSAELKERLHQFEKLGYNVRGFDHWTGPEDVASSSQHAQNRAIYPDEADQLKERHSQSYRVRIPNQADWEAYVNFLTEQKLKALGVDLGGKPEETPLSRSSSQLSPHPFSPPIPTSSAGSQRPGTTGLFPGGFVPGSSNHTSTRSIASPISSLGNPRASLHMHRQSMFVSPPNGPQHAISPVGFTSWSPQPFGNMVNSAGSPGLSSGISDLRSPISPFGAANNEASMPFPFAQRDDLLAQMQLQQQQQLLKQQIQLQQQPQQYIAPPRPTSTLAELAEVPEAEMEDDTGSQTQSAPPEIINPKPGHRHNISAKLEENIAQADRHLERYAQRQIAQSERASPVLVTEPRSPSSAPASVAPSVPEWRRNAPLPPAPVEDELPVAKESNPLALEDKTPAQKEVGRTFEVPEASSDIETELSDDEGEYGASKLAESLTSNPWENDPTFNRSASTQRPSNPRVHSSKISLSGLNVQAKEFNPIANPSANFNPGIFSSSSFAFQPDRAKPFVPRSVPRTSREPTSSPPPVEKSTFNVNAPAFSPSSTFSFSSTEFSFAPRVPSFKPTAPAFLPSSPGFGSDTSAGVPGSQSSSRIFSNINVEDVVKPTKQSKAVPILPPTNSSEQDEDPGEDEFGRTLRGDTKRTRRSGSDGDQVPQFAMPDPFSGAAPLSAKASGTETAAVHTPATTANDESATIPAAGGAAAVDESGEASKDIVVSSPDVDREANVSPVTSEPTEPSELPDTQTTATLQDSISSPLVSPVDAEKSIPEPLLANLLPSARVASASSMLSAMAKPFDFKPSEFTPKGTPQKSNVPSSILSPPTTSPAFTSEEGDTGKLDLQKQREVTSSPRPRLPSSVRYYQNMEQPTFQEIDAVMKHFDEDSEFGVEKDDRSWPNSTPREETGPLENYPELPAATNLRSDAPSPSPGRALLRPVLPVDVDSTSVTHDPFSDGRAAPGDGSPVHRLNDDDAVPVSDWDSFVSSNEDARIQGQGKFLDAHVSELINGALQSRLSPLQEQLKLIEESIAGMTTRPGRRARSRPDDSDADDEDDVETDFNSRTWSPRRDRRMERMKTAVQEALAGHPALNKPSQPTDLTEVFTTLADLRSALTETAARGIQVEDVKSVVGDAFAQHNATLTSVRALAPGKEPPSIEQSEQLSEAILRAAEETEARKAAEHREQETRKLLKLTEEELSLFKESSSDDSQRLRALEHEVQDARQRLSQAENDNSDLKDTISTMSEHSAALKATLNEHRESHSKLREALEATSKEKEKLAGAFGTLKLQSEEAIRIRETMGERLEKLQRDASAATGRLADDRAKWHRSDAEHRTRYEILRTQVQAEARTRERLEKELERLEIQEREGMKLRVILEHTQQEKSRLQSEVETFLVMEREAAKAAITLDHLQKENARLENMVEKLRNESDEHEKAADKYAREYREAREAGRVEVQRTRMLMEADIEAANTRVNMARADFDSELNRLRIDLDNARAEADSNRAKHEHILEQEAESKRNAIREVIEGKTTALHEQRQSFEERMEDLRKQHRRDLDHVIENKNQSETFLHDAHRQRIADLEEQHQRAIDQAIDDKDRIEASYLDRMNLSVSEIELLKDKIAHLEEKLNVTKSAAHAAAQAAQSAKSPVVTSSFAAPAPARQAVGAQALRESIGVLQDQLQERESRIESLETEISCFDKTLPEKLKGKETENTWLRELLGVRMDDLSELVEILGQDDYDREAVRNAAIRLRTGLQMNVHDKERSANGGGPLSAIPANLSASIHNFASPRAAQFARVIGEWRNTPARSSPSSQSFLSGLMTPPASNVRRTPEAPSTAEMRRPSTASVASSMADSAAPFPRPLSVRQQGKSKALEPPRTPPLLRKASYDQDAESGRFSSSGFYDDEDSTVEGTPRMERRRSSAANSPQALR